MRDRLIARFGIENSDNFEVLTIFDKKIDREILDKNNPVLDSLSSKYSTAVWFERKMRDDFGIEIKGSFDNRPLVRHERFPAINPLRKDFDGKRVEFGDFKPYKYETVKGDGVFQVSVGPIHAGIIESGHFHFSQSGERMLHLEVRHFYTYRGIEKSLEGKDWFECKKSIERISGNESIAYQIAWFDIFTQATQQEYPVELKKYHCMLLEFERVAHHLTDIGFIPNDAGFGAALAYASMMAEDVREMLKKICSHRFGFEGVDFEVKGYDKEAVLKFVDELQDKIEWFEDWIVDIPSLWDRFDTTGILSKKRALKYGTVGVVARASGVEIDTRNSEFYKSFGFALQSEKSGDVSARFKLRIKEIYNSITMIRNFIGGFDEVEKMVDFKDGEYMSFVESSIGELFMYVRFKDNLVERFYVRDPSFINWQSLYLMMERDIIADFPLINKSCDLSYAGCDL